MSQLAESEQNVDVVIILLMYKNFNSTIFSETKHKDWCFMVYNFEHTYTHPINIY